MQGNRRDIDETEWTTAQVWDYGKLTHEKGWDWYCCPPDKEDDNDPMLGTLRNHTVVEHEDGTITVSPSILVGQGTTNTPWHGFLERGIWREV